MKKRIIIFLIICFLFVTGSSVAESVKLTALKPYFDGYIEINNKNITDSLGNRYSTYIRGYIQKKDAEKFDCYSIWSIQGKYRRLTATQIVWDRNNGSKNTCSYKIYGDSKLLYSNTYDSRQKPQSVVVDITGVNDLKIEMYGEGNMGFDGMSSVLADIYLTK